MTATHPPALPAMAPAPGARTAPASPYGAMAAPVFTPQPAAPVYVQAPAPQRGASSAGVGIAVVLLAVVAAVAGYLVAREQAPSAEEIARYQQIAASEGFRAGQYEGVAEGRSFAIQSQRRIAQYRAAIARQKAWNSGYRRGMNIGKRGTARRSTGYAGYGGYRGPTYRGPSNNQRAVSSALASAQALANATGAPVDVEIY